jgi:hypothetical protein
MLRVFDGQGELALEAGMAHAMAASKFDGLALLNLVAHTNKTFSPVIMLEMTGREDKYAHN